MNIQHFPLMSLPLVVQNLLNCCQLHVVTTDNCKNKSFQTNFFLFFSRFHSYSVDNGRRHRRLVLVVPVFRYQTILKNLPFHSCRYRNLKLQHQLLLLLLEHYYYYYDNFRRNHYRQAHCWPPIRLSKTIKNASKLIFVNGIYFVNKEESN